MAFEDIILGLNDSDLVAMASALRSGRLESPPSTLALAHLIGATEAALAVSALNSWAARGLNREQIAWALDLALQARRKRPRVEDNVELVVTGPETAGILMRDTAAAVHEMFSRAEISVTVVGYAVHKGQQVFKALAERMRVKPSLRVRMLLDIQRGHDRGPSKHLVAKFLQRFTTVEWPTDSAWPEVYYYPPSLESSGDNKSSLHAKCVIVDEQVAFVSSANFTQAAHERNIEVGVTVRSSTVAGFLSKHFDRLLVDGVLVRIL